MDMINNNPLFRPLKAHNESASSEHIKALANHAESLAVFLPGANAGLVSLIEASYGARHVHKLTMFGSGKGLVPAEREASSGVSCSKDTPLYWSLQQKLVAARRRLMEPIEEAWHLAAVEFFHCVRFQPIPSSLHRGHNAEALDFLKQQARAHADDINYREIAIPAGMPKFRFSVGGQDILCDEYHQGPAESTHWPAVLTRIHLERLRNQEAHSAYAPRR